MLAEIVHEFCHFEESMMIKVCFMGAWHPVLNLSFNTHCVSPTVLTLTTGVFPKSLILIRNPAATSLCLFAILTRYEIIYLR